MWPFKKKVKQRRLEVRRSIPAAGPTRWQRLRAGGGLVSMLLAAVFYVVALLLDICPIDPLPYRAGQYVPADLSSRVAFQVRLSGRLEASPEVPADRRPSTAPSTAPATKSAEPRQGSRQPAYRQYEPGHVLVNRAARAGLQGAGLTGEELKLLALEHKEWLAQRSAGAIWARACGRAVIVLLVVVLLCLYMVRYEGAMVRDHWRGLAIVVTMLLMLGVNKTMVSVLGWNPHVAVLVVVMASFVMAIAYDQRVAMTVGSILAVLVTLQLRGDLGMLIVLLAGVMPGVFLLHEIRTRSKLIEVSGICAGVVFAAVWALAWSARVPWRFALVSGLWSAGFAVLAGFLVQGVLPLIERAFGVATSMTLLEWCDASKPLLKRLAIGAPGTYNHSLQLGAMCELAAEAVGARGLLARVGAYYHDVGKANKPEYFVENQGGMPSKHEKLSPAMSLLIIVGHVKDGIEMAREYNLPRVLHEFIATHHGTTLVHHFFEAAARQRKTDNGRAPDEVEFRYPGPKPAGREAAILMLADAAESSVRSMEDPTPPRIENQVHAMVSRRLMDEQLDECDLTLREVHKIEASLTKSLCSIYHARIAYPTPAGQEPSAAELPGENGKNRQEPKTESNRAEKQDGPRENERENQADRRSAS